MRNNGTGIYYTPGLPLDYQSQIMSAIGFYFGSATQTVTNYGYSSQNGCVFMETFGGYRRELFNERIAGIFRPVFILQGGGAVKLKTLSWDNILGNWTLISAVGTGFQFYNGKILNEMLLKLNQYFSENRSISLNLSIYWK